MLTPQRMILTELRGLILKDSSCRCSQLSLEFGYRGQPGTKTAIIASLTVLKLFSLLRCGLTVFALLKLCRYHQQENIRVSEERTFKHYIIHVID